MRNLMILAAETANEATVVNELESVEDFQNLILQGNYEGLYILKKENDKWVLRNKIKGFGISSRHLEFIKQDEVLVSHEQKGVYKLKIDTGFNQVLSYSKTVVKKSIKSSLNTYNNKVLYGSNSGVFFYDTNSLDFKKDSILSNLYDFTSYISGKLINANNKLFAFTEQNISYVQRERLSAKYELFSIPVPNSVRETKDGYENILYIGDDKYLIGITSGYIITDLTYRNKINHTIKLDEVSAHSIKNKEKSLSLVKRGALENKENHIKISYSISNYSKYFPSLFRYMIY